MTDPILTAAGLSVVPERRVWAVQSNGQSFAWCGTEEEANTLAWELAAEMIADGLVGEIVPEVEWM